MRGLVWGAVKEIAAAVLICAAALVGALAIATVACVYVFGAAFRDIRQDLRRYRAGRRA
jgi:hypothetical protein